MAEEAEILPTSASERFYSGAEGRILRAQWIIGSLAIIGAWIAWHYLAALGLLAGVVLAVFNTRWLHRSVRKASTSIAEESSAGHKPWFTGTSLAFGLVLRLALVSAVGYAIVKGSRVSFYGFLCGLSTSIAALCVEAAYEAWVAMRRGL